MQRFIDSILVSSASGMRPLGNAQVTVYEKGTSNLAVIYSDNGFTQKDNPFLSDAEGGISFYAADGRYDIRAVHPLHPEQWVRDVLLMDVIDDGFVRENDLGELAYQSTLGVTDSASIHLSGGGSAENPVTASVVLSDEPENLIEITEDGLYADDQAVRTDLSSTDPGKGAAMVGRNVIAVDSIADLLALPEGARRGDLGYSVKGYVSAADGNGGDLYWDAERPKADHDGVRVFSPTVTPIADQDPTQVNNGRTYDYQEKREYLFRQGTGETDPSGNGCFVSQKPLIDIPVRATSITLTPPLGGNDDVYIRDPEIVGDYVVCLVKGDYGSSTDESAFEIFWFDAESERFTSVATVVIPIIGVEWRTVFVYDQYMYIVGFGGGPKRVLVYDITDITSPSYVQEISLDIVQNGFSKPIVFGSILVFGTWGGASVQSFDFSDPLNPILKSKAEGYSSSGAGSQIFYYNGFIWQILYSNPGGGDYLAKLRYDEDTQSLSVEDVYSDPSINGLRRGVMVGGNLYVGTYNGTGIYKIDVHTNEPIVAVYDGDISDTDFFSGVLAGSANRSSADFAFYRYDEANDRFLKTIVGTTQMNYVTTFRDGFLSFSQVGVPTPTMHYWKFPVAWHGGEPAKNLRHDDGLIERIKANLYAVTRGAIGHLVRIGGNVGPVILGTLNSDLLRLVQNNRVVLQAEGNNEVSLRYSKLEERFSRGPSLSGVSLRRYSFVKGVTAIGTAPTPIVTVRSVASSCFTIRLYVRRAAGGSTVRGSGITYIHFATGVAGGPYEVIVEDVVSQEAASFNMPTFTFDYTDDIFTLYASSDNPLTSVTFMGFVEGTFQSVTEVE